MKTIERIKQIVKADIAREQVGIDLFKRIRTTLTRFEGKKITKLLANAVAKDLGPEFDVHFDSNYGQFHICVRKVGQKYDEALRFFIGYEVSSIRRDSGIFHIGKPGVEHSGFEYYSCCYGSAAEARNAKREFLLRSEKILKGMAQAIDKAREAAKELAEFSEYDYPSWYRIEKLLKEDA